MIVNSGGFAKYGVSVRFRNLTKVLKVVGETLRNEARGADVVVRYGGDEFLVIMPRGDAGGAPGRRAGLERETA